MSEKGKIIINPKWDLTERRKVALERLSELGVGVRSHVGKSDFLIEIPLRPSQAEYIEIGYLMAQLGDENFPNDCEGFSTYQSFVLPKVIGRHPHVRWKENHPAYMEFVVKPKKDR